MAIASEPELLLSPPTRLSFGAPTKSSTIPPTHVLRKRPLLHPPIPPINSKRSPQTIYIAAHTPFVSVIKRVRKILAAQDSTLWASSLDSTASEQSRRIRNYQHQKRCRGTGGRGGSGRVSAKGASERGEPAGEGVLLKATGRAINKCLSVGLHLLKDETLKIKIYTGTVDVVDDVIKIPRGVEHPKSQNTENRDSVSPTIITPAIIAPQLTPSSTPTPSPLHMITTSKRKAIDLQPDSSPSSISPRRAHRTHLRKRPRTTKQSNDNTTITTPIGAYIDNISVAMPDEVIAGNASIDARRGNGEGDDDLGDHHGEDDDSDSFDDDDLDNDNDDDYTRTRKTSMLQIEITLLRP